MEAIARWLLTILLIYLAGGAALYFLQRFFLYFPRSYVAVPGVKEVTLVNGGTRLQGYIANEGKARLLLYYGGNAEQVAVGIAELADDLPGVTIIGFDYRGYGKSGGRATEANLYDDALFQYDHFAGDYSSVNLLGRSLGSAVATFVAGERETDRLVLVTPIDSVARIAAARFWFYPTDWLLKDRFDSLSRASGIRARVLMLTAVDDTLVPLKRLQNLQQAFTRARVTRVDIPNVGHNTIQNSPLFGRYIRDFLQGTNSP